jgi:DNA-binding transcriptional LysR family regulator
MDYNKLKTFAVVAETGSVTRAAHLLRRSQPAISQQIGLLESELGFKLLERKSSRVYLSPEGTAIRDLAKEKLGGIDAGIARLKKTAEAIEGHISVGALCDYGVDFRIGSVVARFAREHPRVTFSVKRGSAKEIEVALATNEVDLGFLITFEDDSLFNRIAIRESTHSLYASPAYLEKFGPIKTYKSLLDAHLVDLREDFLGLKAFFRKNAKTLVPSLSHRSPAIVAPSIDVMKDVLVAGFGIGMLPDYFAAGDVKAKKLAHPLKSAEKLSAVLDAAYRNNRTLKRREKAFLNFIARG